MTTRKKTRAEFDYEITARGPGYNAPQRMGRRLWPPMLLMAVTAWPIGLILSWARAAEIASASPDPTTIARLGQLVPAFMFIGFAAVFSAISFAIARILGAFRRGGGEVQKTARRDVQTLRMPPTARAFMVSMMMGMLAILVPVVLHLAVAAKVDQWAADSVERWSAVLEGFRRLGVALYLFGIALGLGTIIHVLHFQSVRVRQLAAEPRRPA